MRIGTSDKIEVLAPILAENFIDIEIPQSTSDAYFGKVDAYKKRMGVAARYFFYNLHDSTVLSLKKKNRRDLQLVLNDIATLDFASALIDRKGLGLKARDLEFPLVISSIKTRHLSLNRVDGGSGKITPCRFRKVDEYLYEEIIAWEEGRIEIAFDLWCWRCDPLKRCLLLLSCEELEFEEKQDEAWERYFPESLNHYYEHFKARRRAGEFLSDYTLCLKLIDEYDKEIQ